ncbi:unnamed protein product [Pylaiella littoralis]
MSGSGSELGGAVSAVFVIQLSTWCMLTYFSFRSLFSGCVLRLGLVCWSFTFVLCTHVFAVHEIHPPGYFCVFVCSLLFDVIILFVCPRSVITSLVCFHGLNLGTWANVMSITTTKRRTLRYIFFAGGPTLFLA